jgi:hypothetical protein
VRLGWIRIHPVMEEIKRARWMARGNEISYVEIASDFTTRARQTEWRYHMIDMKA